MARPDEAAIGLTQQMDANARIERLGSIHAMRRPGGTLTVAPVIGELGHELMSSAMARAASRHYDKTIVWTRPGREILYADFAEVKTHDIKCEGMVMQGYQTLDGARQYLHSGFGAIGYPSGSAVLILPEYCQRYGAEFRLHGSPDPEFCGVTVFHARSRKHVQMRNWPARNWQALAKSIRDGGFADRIVCIGTPGDALLVPGCEDQRSFSLERQMNILNSARWCIGPSSGPMHVAEHCGCPVVVWCGGGSHERSRVASRYRKEWNPFSAPCVAVQCASWQPSPASVYSWCRALIEELSK